ncbi:hypothetical protein GM708_05740 [Vibrio cholerae]|nr:hypothetical protein [Vibrio cholerae]
MSEGTVGLTLLLLTLVLLPAVCVFVTRQAAEGSIGRNAAAGIRTRHTQASDGAWIAGHAAALPVVRRMRLVAVAGILAAVGAHLTIGGQAGPVTAFGALVVQTVVLLRSAAVANRAARLVIGG